MKELRWTVLGNRACRLGESPRWHAGEERVYWTDIDSRALWRIHLDGSGAESCDLDQKAGCLVLREQGGLVLAMEDGIYAGDPFAGERLERLCAHPDPAFVAGGGRFNDGRCDARGRLWVGTIDPEARGGAALYMLDPQTMQIETVQEGFSTFNGLAFHPNADEVWYADSEQWSVYRSDFDLERGAIGPRKPLYEWSREQRGRPDGAAFDKEHCYWTVLYEGSNIVRFDAQGGIIFEQRLPLRFPTMPCFAGPDLDHLVVSSALGDDPEAELVKNPEHAGRVLVAQSPVVGLPEPAFAG